jgi:hypothetical protein
LPGIRVSMGRETSPPDIQVYWRGCDSESDNGKQ